MKAKLINAFTAVILLLLPNVNFGQAPTLGTSSTYALFTAVGAFNNIGATTTVTGDVGTNVGAFNAFPPGILVGQINVANSASAQAATDVDVAYSFLDGITTCTVIGTTLGSGQNLTPDVYCLGAASTLNGDLILDGQGDPSSLFIFKIDGALATTVNSRVILTNSASICNVYWQVNGQVDLGDNSLFQGTILANGAINLLEAAKLLGRGLSRAGAISLHNNIVTLATGSTASTITASGPTTFCPGGSVILSGNIGGIWSNGATTPSITVTTGGDYFVENTNACGGSVTSNHIIVTVNPLSCTFTGNDSICVGESNQLCVPFSDSSTYLWSTGATTNCITVTSGGKYSVTITNADGCSSTCSKTITETSAPSCDITGRSEICEGTSTSLCAPYGNGYTYLWSNGATTRCIPVNTAGTFSVTVTKDEDEHQSSACSKTVTVTPAPSCIIEGSSVIFPGESTQLCAPSSDTSTYLWSTGATTNCITVSEEGAYSVTVTNADGCERTCKKTVKVTPAPSCIIEGSSVISQGQFQTSLCTPYGNGYTYLWSTGATTRCIMVNAAGTFSVTVTKNESSVTCSKTVTLTDAPNCTISGNSSVCEGQSTQLCSPYGKGYTYLWSTGATTRCITVNAAGTFSATVTKDGLSSACSKTVTVAPLSCNIRGSSTICEGTSTALCAPTGNGYTYLWSTGATSSCITVDAAGTYSVELTKNGCTSACSKTVTVAAPSSTIISGSSATTGSSAICEGTSTSLCAPYGYGYTYLWSTGATSRCITVDAAGTFSLTVTQKGCSSTSSETVIVNPNPNCSITGNLFPSQGQTTMLCAPEGLSSYQWSTGATTRCITVDCSGTYSVVTNSIGCLSSCNVYVTYPSSSGNASVGGKISGAESNFKVSAYPNPFYSTAIIELQNTDQNTESNSHIVVELYSTTENKIGTLFDGEVKPGGLYKVEVNAADLPAGIYIYRITNGYQVINRKLLLKR